MGGGLHGMGLSGWRGSEEEEGWPALGQVSPCPLQTLASLPKKSAGMWPSAPGHLPYSCPTCTSCVHLPELTLPCHLHSPVLCAFLLLTFQPCPSVLYVLFVNNDDFKLFFPPVHPHPHSHPHPPVYYSCVTLLVVTCKID